MQKKRLAIIGGGSSGLICLKYALDELPDWEIVCFEKTGEITGCWGRPPRGFVSTSTKYTTQFACHRLYDATTRDDSESDSYYSEFFRDDEYGEYLESFVAAFGLAPHIVRNCHIDEIERTVAGDWKLTLLRAGVRATEQFSAVVICTGLADQVKRLDCDIEVLRSIDPDCSITDKRIVVVGGGESAVDMAQRLSQPELKNKVFLSLRSGIRVSPRYHPIRGVPSDFLRNRLMLSIHEDIRNWIGHRFVEFRIRWQELLERIFPAATNCNRGIDQSAIEIRRSWDLKLTRAAKDELFNMFHNKSDDFLDSVGEGRITIVGENIDDRWHDFRQFESAETISVCPELVVPSIGFQSRLGEISQQKIELRGFYLGCCHVEYDNLFLIGFTRPIIGNIPSISEMQACYICGLISGRVPRPSDMLARHQSNRAKIHHRYSCLNTDEVYPVEMFPYCDVLARQMNCYPSRKRMGLMRWIRMMLSPATTLHYFDMQNRKANREKEPIYAPALITALLLLVLVFDRIYRRLSRASNSTVAKS